jgi:hypothetical protein
MESRRSNICGRWDSGKYKMSTAPNRRRLGGPKDFLVALVIIAVMAVGVYLLW